MMNNCLPSHDILDAWDNGKTIICKFKSEPNIPSSWVILLGKNENGEINWQADICDYKVINNYENK